MKFENEDLDMIHGKTNGRCHLCQEPVKRAHYGNLTSPTGWEVDHSKAQAKGGTHHLNNLYPAHPRCNRSKGAKSSASVRSENGVSGPPMSAAQIEKKRGENTVAGAGLGAIGGVALAAVVRLAGVPFGPAGLLFSTLAAGVIGAVAAHNQDPEKQ
jgi:HNH endonuclease